MTPEIWQKIKPILEQALELDVSSRVRFLEEKCETPEILREAKSLLECQTNGSDRLDHSAFDVIMGDKPAKSLIGKQVGRYKIISELGAGGMGVVFLAERSDGEFDQRVALKLIKTGIGSDSILRRFYSERQILASLDHPNIAHLIDGGTTDDDLPYFVLEYVEGETIIKFANRRELNIEARLDLFRKVCDGVSYAHQNLVIHRDLKPSNILVNQDGIPKLLDFGIAKLLDAENKGETGTHQMAFTPDYASPEQIAGRNLTTTTDLYSLGVILYELLTGLRPFHFEGKNFGEILHTSSNTPPLRPSEVESRELRIEKKGDSGFGFPALNSRMLSGDLDNIILKALNKEPERRYSSVEQFSEDIRRHLQGLPVRARQDNWRYRAGKFARRNPLFVGSITLAFLILIAGIVATAYQARLANTERAKAERRFSDVRTLANSFIFEVNDKIGESPIKARELLVSRSVEYLDKLAAESEGDIGLQSELAAAYQKIGDVQADIFSPNLGNSSGGFESQKKALILRQQLYDKAPNQVERGIDLVSSNQKVGSILSITGNTDLALEHYRSAIRLSETMAAGHPQHKNIRVQLSNSHILLGQAILRSGELSECLRNYEAALEITRRLVQEDPESLNLQRSLAVLHSYIGYVQMLMGEFDLANSNYENALAIDQRMLESDPRNLRFQGSVATSYLWVGIGARESGKNAAALDNIGKALALQSDIFALDKLNYGEQNSLADCQLELGMALITAKRSDAAITSFQKAIVNYSAVVANDASNIASRRQISLARRLMADAILQKGNVRDALKNYREALTVFSELISLDPNNLEWKHDAAISEHRIGRSLIILNDSENGAASLGRALPVLENLHAISPENVFYLNDLTDARKQIAGLIR